jgi:hypothetical protein
VIVIVTTTTLAPPPTTGGKLNAGVGEGGGVELGVEDSVEEDEYDMNSSPS